MRLNLGKREAGSGDWLTTAVWWQRAASKEAVHPFYRRGGAAATVGVACSGTVGWWPCYGHRFGFNGII
jgi:hypothetical protein